ncbi:MAG: hypothetical protein IR160_05865 [Salinibacterium sp.]|nr:hypothetical protein [Salinibacterium sp.]MBF0672095.1 hypothetical protein [Salinibacterium sp.]
MEERTELLEVAGDEHPSSDASRVTGWGRVLRGNRVLWVVAASAVIALAAGLLIGRFIAPAEAGEAPEPGLVTVPVEFGPLSNDVTLRADVGYADAVDVTVDTASLDGAAIVTGQVPEQGAELAALSVALEVAGRPIIVLPGELPAYRTLRVGVSGPDVLQLKQALTALGIGVGDATSPMFDRTTAEGVRQLYAQVGYPAPAPAEGATEMLRSAEEALRSAQGAVAAAQQGLAAAGAGPSTLDVWQADVAVADAERAVEAARSSGGDVQGAEWALKTAQLQREQLFAARDTSAEQSELASAHAQVQAATEALTEAQVSVLPHLPAGEVAYLTELPRRVDAVNVARGAAVQGPVMTVSGASVRLTGAAAEADARLLSVGGEASFELPDGTVVGATIAAIEEAKGAASRRTVLLDPAELTPEQVEQIKGKNVRVRVPVGATEGDVLSVPLAALTAGPGGEERVEIVESDPRDGEDAKTRVVLVETGLAARGAVEIRPLDGEIEEGELVVVGR